MSAMKDAKTREYDALVCWLVLINIRNASRYAVSLGKKTVLVQADDAHGALEPPNRRLCPTCSILQPSDESCKQAHLQKIYHENPTGECKFYL